MAVTARGSKFSRNNWLIVAVACLGAGLYFAYDGWISEKYQTKETNEAGEPSTDLLFNRYVPIPMAAVAAYGFIMAAIIPRRRVVADEKGLTLANGSSIAYQSIRAIDKGRFEKDGVLEIHCEINGAKKLIKLSDRKFDNLGLLLDELVRQTGAAPADATKNGRDNPGQA